MHRHEQRIITHACAAMVLVAVAVVIYLSFVKPNER